MALCLGGICLVCAAILGGVYALTQKPIEDAKQKALVASIAKVLPEGGEISGSMSAEGIDEYYVSGANGTVLAYAVKTTSAKGFGGPLCVMVGVLPDGTVYNTSVLICNETPGLGAKCATDEGFMGQWKGFGPDKILKVRKDGGDVDAITASTITSRAYAEAVEKAVVFIKSLGGPAEGLSEGPAEEKEDSLKEQGE